MSATCPVYLRSLRIVALRVRRKGPRADQGTAPKGRISADAPFIIAAIVAVTLSAACEERGPTPGELVKVPMVQARA